MPSRGVIGIINEIRRNDDELSLEWQIKDFLTLSNAGVDFYDSPDFCLGGERWFVRVWPSGMTWAAFDWVDLHLFRREPGPRLKLSVSVGIKGSSAEGRRVKTHEFSSGGDDDDCGWSNLCLRSTLQDLESCLMPDGVLTIACDVKRYAPRQEPPTTDDVSSREAAVVQLEALAAGYQSPEEQVDVESNQEVHIQAEAISEDSQSTENQAAVPLHRHGDVICSMRALLEGGRRSDFALRRGGRWWPLHKVILEARSPHFAHKFQEEWAESAEGEIPSDDVTEEALDNALRFMYTGEVRDLYVEDLCDLYIAAHRCQLEDLKPLCVDSMKENMCAEIVCGALAIAKTHNEGELNEVALDYLVQEAEKIFDTEEWEELKQKRPEILAELLEERTKRGRVV